MEEKPKRCGKNVWEWNGYRDMFISKQGSQRIQNQKRRKLERYNISSYILSDRNINNIWMNGIHFLEKYFHYLCTASLLFSHSWCTRSHTVCLQSRNRNLITRFLIFQHFLLNKIYFSRYGIRSIPDPKPWFTLHTYRNFRKSDILSFKVAARNLYCQPH